MPGLPDSIKEKIAGIEERLGASRASFRESMDNIIASTAGARPMETPRAEGYFTQIINRLRK